MKIVFAIVNTLLSIFLGYVILVLSASGSDGGHYAMTLKDVLEIGIFSLLICISTVSVWVMALKPSTSRIWKIASFGNFVIILFFLILMGRASGFPLLSWSYYLF